MKGYVAECGKIGYRFFPKVACTSIKSALYKIEEKKDFVREDVGMYVHRFVDKHKVNDMDECENRLVVIRDPIKRFLSAYGNRVTFHSELSREFVKNKFPDCYDKIPYFDPGLGQFIDNLKIYLNVGPIRHHVRPLSFFLDGQDLSYFTDVYKMEDIPQFESKLSELFGQEVVFERKQTGGRKFELRDLSKAQINKLLKYYKKDYKLLKDYYSVESVWSEWKGVSHKD